MACTRCVTLLLAPTSCSCRTVRCSTWWATLGEGGPGGLGKGIPPAPGLLRLHRRTCFTMPDLTAQGYLSTRGQYVHQQTATDHFLCQHGGSPSEQHITLLLWALPYSCLALPCLALPCCSSAHARMPWTFHFAPVNLYACKNLRILGPCGPVSCCGCLMQAWCAATHAARRGGTGRLHLAAWPSHQCSMLLFLPAVFQSALPC